MNPDENIPDGDDDTAEHAAAPAHEEAPVNDTEERYGDDESPV